MSYWTRPERPVRRRRAVTVEGIAEATLGVLDADGLRGLTTRSLAQRLGVAPASIYSRVSTIDDALDLAVDRALTIDRTLRAQVLDGTLESLMLAWYRHLVQRPWLPGVAVARIPSSPAYRELSARLLALVAPVGEDRHTRLSTSYALSNFVLGSAAAACTLAESDRLGTSGEAPTAEDDPIDPEQVFEHGLHAMLRGFACTS